VLWPEAAPPFAITGPRSAQARELIRQLTDATGHPLLFGAVGAAPPGPNSMTSPGYYDGIFFQRLVLISIHFFTRSGTFVPFGEYVPLRGWLPFWAKSCRSKATPCPEKARTRSCFSCATATCLRAGALVCYEDVFANLARSEVQAGADFLVVLTNDSWYGTGGGALQHAAHSVLRAIETRRPIIRCGNDGWSGMIDEQGDAFPLTKDGAKIQAGWILSAKGTTYFRGAGELTLFADRRYASKETFYVEFGDWFVGLSALLAVPECSHCAGKKA